MKQLLIILLLSSFAYAGIVEDAEQYKDDVQDFIGTEPVVVIGDHLSKSERLAIAYITENYPEASQYPTVKASEVTDNDIEGRPVVLIGGPNQNRITANIIASDDIRHEEVFIGMLSFINASGGRYLVLSDKAGHYNARRAPENSPLKNSVPIQYIPIAASAIGMALLWTGKFVGKLAHKVLRRAASAKIMAFVRKREFNPKYKGFKVKGVRFKYREWLAIILSAFAFAAAVSFTYFYADDSIIGFVLLSFLVNTVIYTLRGLFRLYLDKVYNLHTEFVFWYWGGVVTIVTGWLGNAFCLTGYTLSDRETKKESRIQYSINFWTFLAAIILLILNLFMPSTIVQMAGILALAIAFINMLPMYPFAGRNIYRWRKSRWWLSFIPMAVVYVGVNLIV